jgi:hypothetical protein
MYCPNVHTVLRCTECKVQHVQALRFAPHGEVQTRGATMRTSTALALALCATTKAQL